MKKLLEDIENIIRTKFGEDVYCEIMYNEFFEDEIDIKFIQGSWIINEILDENYIEHRDELVKEIDEKFSDKIKSMELYAPDVDMIKYVYGGFDFRGIEIKVNMKKVKKLSDDIMILI